MRLVVCIGLALFSLVSFSEAASFKPTFHGPALGTAVRLPGGPKYDAFRGIIVRLDESSTASVVFDADTMRMAAGWTEGGLKLQGLPFSGGHGQFPVMTGSTLFQVRNAPGWSKGGSLAEPRTGGGTPPLGPLPRDWAKFRGWYLHGDQVIFSYTVGQAQVLDSPRLVSDAGRKVIARTIEIKGDGKPSQMVVADSDKIEVNGEAAKFSGSAACIVGGPKGAKFEVVGDQLVLSLPAFSDTQRLQLAVWKSDGKDTVAVRKSLGTAAELAKLTKGGPTLWSKEPIVTKGMISTDTTSAFVVDQLTLPKNPYGGNMRIGGFDFFADGTSAALSTWDGEVWIVRGIDDKLEKLEWKRFAAGLHEPLGLKIVDDVIYTVADDQITRFHDQNGDGEADFYENFNNDWDLTSGFHAFCFDLHTDKEGNFYFAFGCPVRGGGRSFERMGRHHGAIIRVSPDGKKMERYATGLRAPNGIGVSPTGQVTAGDNEGTFVPRCPIHWVEQGEFLGVVDAAADYKEMKTTPTVAQLRGDRKQHLDASEAPLPLVWLPKNVDNSGGGQVWVTSDRWGPLKGEMLHMSYGTSSIYLVLKEAQGDVIQGGVVKLPVKFTSSAMRACFNKLDGQLYVTGLRGWQTNAVKPGGFDRVRFTGKPLHLPVGLKVKKGGVEITFSEPLDKEAAADPDNYSVDTSNIRWSQDYGSKDYDRNEHLVDDAMLLADGKTVYLEIEDFRPAHQMKIGFNIKSADGTKLRNTIWNTVHVVPKN